MKWIFQAQGCGTCFRAFFFSLLSTFSWNKKNQKRYLIPPLKHCLHLHCCKNYIVTELWLSSLWRTSKSFTFAESHFEINIWEGWREVFPYIILTVDAPFGLLAAAFVMISRDLFQPLQFYDSACLGITPEGEALERMWENIPPLKPVSCRHPGGFLEV